MKLMCPLNNLTPLKLKHKIDRYIRYVNIVNVALFTKNTFDFCGVMIGTVGTGREAAG